LREPVAPRAAWLAAERALQVARAPRRAHPVWPALAAQWQVLVELAAALAAAELAAAALAAAELAAAALAAAAIRAWAAPAARSRSR
jgi:hypothetical protein